MADTDPLAAGHDDYCRGYSADVDTIREQEYPLLNGMMTLLTRQEFLLTFLNRNHLSRPCRNNTICQVSHRVLLA